MSTHFNENISNLKSKLASGFTKIKDKSMKYTEDMNLENSFYSNPWYFGVVELLQYIIFIVLIYHYNPFNITNNHPAFINVMVLIVSFIYVALFYYLKSNINITLDLKETTLVLQILKTVMAFALFVFLTLGIAWLFKHLSILTALLHYSVLILIIISTVAILYLLLKPSITTAKDKAKSDISSGWSFAWNLILFIPCLLVDIMGYFKHQYQLTTKPIWMLLLFEIILITLWFVVPILFHKISTHDGKHLLDHAIYLNNEKTLGNFDTLHNRDGQTDKFKYHYSLSAWIYINPQPPNTSSAYTKYTDLLNYGNKPAVQYNGKLNSLRVMAQVGKASDTENKGDLVEVFETKDIIYQKWNNIVINYDGGNMDVFLNGELVGSKPNIAPYMTYENIVTGTKDGIHGGICNVTYYNSIMKKSTIMLMYRLLRDKDVPL